MWGGNEAGESAARHPEATPARGLSRGRVRRGPRVRGERSRGASDVGSWAGGGGLPAFPLPAARPRPSAAPARRLEDPGSEDDKKDGEICRTLVFLRQPLYESPLPVHRRRGQQRAD